MNEAVKQQLSDIVKKNKVVLFMKGNRQFPQCGFSAQVVEILNELLPSYETVNVLSAPELRDGIKEFSSWPTIPQLYVGGEFVGGCDIVKEMYAAGELQKVLGVEGASTPSSAPKVTLTASAATAFKDAAEPGSSEVVRLEISAQFAYELFFAPPRPGDLQVESRGIVIHVDKASARRADGLSIDFVDQAGGGGFKMENPNEPPRVKPLSAKELAALFAAGEKVELFDVRPESERALAKIDRARSLDDAGKRHLASLDKSAKIVLHCHHGMRSRAAGEQLLREGYKNVFNLEGGIEAWSASVDSSVPRY